ncbi:hypothetical protein WP12_20745 [Sphingomonas sp. SRS2]|nr:hypothetical protein WP12_20745 [Sphingomonas sp. SRS2]
MLTNPAAIIGALMPTFVDAFVARGLDVGTAATLGSIELFSMAITVVLAPLIVNRWNRRAIALCAILLAAIGQLGSMETADPFAIGILRMAAGVGEGALYAVAVASIAAMAAPDRTFGLAVACNLVTTTALLALIVWYARSAPAAGAMLVTGAFVAIHMAFLLALPKHGALPASRQNAPSHRDGPTASPVAVLSGLLGMFLLFFGFGLVWPMASQIAAYRGLDADMIATALSVAGFGGIAGAGVATVLGLRFGRVLPLVSGTLAMALGLWLIGTNFFVAAALLVMFSWAFNLPYYLGLMASLDLTGRIAVLTSGMIPFGAAAGQVMAGLIKDGHGFAAVTFCGSAALVAALAAILHTATSRTGAPLPAKGQAR